MTLKGLLLIDLYLDNRGRLKSKLYDKRDDFTFPIVTFPFIGSNILEAPAVGVENQILKWNCKNLMNPDSEG
jgi:hypothetical protein